MADVSTRQHDDAAATGPEAPGDVAVTDAAVGADDDLNTRLFFRLFQAANVYERQAMGELGLSGIQGAVLGELSRAPADGIAFSKLVEYLAVSRQNLDAVLKRLESAGLVIRTEGHADRRTRMVKLTQQGHSAWAGMRQPIMEFFRQATLGLDRAERIACTDALVRIARALRVLKLSDSARARGRASMKPPADKT